MARTLSIIIYILFCREDLHQAAGEKWHMVSPDVQAQMARMAAASAWGLGKGYEYKVPIIALT